MPSHPLFELQTCTLAELIDAGADYLTTSTLIFGHGTDNAFDEAAWLALEACDRNPAQPIDDYQVVLNRGHLERAKDWFKRRAETRTPVAYITGRSWFAGLELLTDERALIPRSPIAELILNQFQPWLPQPPASILDLCCGGGCIAIASAVAFPDAVVHGCDLSADALSLAADNVAKHSLQDRVSLFQGDLYRALPTDRRYDLIVSNPPYVDKQDMDDLALEFRHEPEMGLAAGIDGLDIVERILSDAAGRLSEHGVLIVEVGNSQPALEARFSALNLVWLEFEMGGAGVFLIDAKSLPGCQTE